MKKHSFKYMILAVVSLAAFALAGCQTSKGFGKDVEKLGEEIQDAAN